ncbi:uncharacterized protein EI90DRAFT_1091894 [Cantharellus anzutake]|uniref:uncharacterized protein n=1 Tax=Cantharellus anzutake TaxID=1750568 RepID=UPI0019067885|nr:uncharacterized protein EI90DRAFT_1091894 [Cantharellus anzutake]KAF8330740.1 hypothetical protein EI90DRAFT_1091894 [Cantharellus anzutake]
MFDRLKFSNRGHSPAPPGGSSRPSTSVPSLQITTPPIESVATTSTDRGGSDRSGLKPLTTTGGSSRGRKQRWSVRHTIAKLLSRSPGPDPTDIDQSKPSDHRQSSPSTPDPPPPNLSPSPVLPEGAIDIPHMMPHEPIIHNNTETPHPPPGRTSVNSDAPSSTDRTPSSSAVPAGDGKKTIIAATKLVLQTAASALKFAPIPNVDQIPSILLKWLQVYEVRRCCCDFAI